MNVLCGVLGNGLIGPFFFDNNLTADMKTLVYETKLDSRAALRRRIFAAADRIRNHPHNISSAIESLLIRAGNCIASGGGHYEQVL